MLEPGHVGRRARAAPPRAAPARSRPPRGRRSSQLAMRRILSGRGYTARMARRGGWPRKGRKGRFRYYDATREADHRPRKIERIEALVDSACVAGRLDLAAPEREAPGDRSRPRRAAPVPLPPGVPSTAGAGEVRQARPLRRAPARTAQGDEQGHGRRAARARVDLRARAAPDQPRLVPRRLPSATRRRRGPSGSRRCESST